MEILKLNTVKDKWIICRICLKRDQNGLRDLIELQIDKIIDECFTIKLSLNKNYPNKVCVRCFLLLKAAVKFRRLTINSEMQLNELYNKPIEFLTDTDVSDDNENDVSSKNPTINQNEERKQQYHQQQQQQRDFDDNEDAESKMKAEIVEIDSETEDYDVEEQIDDNLNNSNCEYVNLRGQQLEYLQEEENVNYMSEENSYETTTFEIVEQVVDNQEDNDDEILTVVSTMDEDIVEEFSSRTDTSKRKQKFIKLNTDADPEYNIEEPDKKVARKRKCRVKQDGDIIETKFICSKCGNTYTERAKLTAHMKIHTKERPHECEICHKRFAQTPQLARHMNSHTGERPYKCKFCNAGFADPSTCIKHQRIHTNERPFKCNVCGKSFSYSNVLKVHKMIHTGEKPYTCKFCGKCFSQSHHKNAHERTHTLVRME